MGYFDDIQVIHAVDDRVDEKNKRNPLVFKHYRPDALVKGKKMRDHLRFAVCYWHTWRGTGRDMFGEETINYFPQLDTMPALDAALERVKIHFEFLEKLGVDYYTFHDRDIAPVVPGDIRKTNENLDRVVSLMKQYQNDTGKKLLWGTSNLFTSKDYMNGAATNPDPAIFAQACAQVQKAMEVTKELGGENYVFWGGREGFTTLLNTNLKQELDQYAMFLRMAADYKKKIGFNGTLLIEPKPREPTAHQYDFDVGSTYAFLQRFGLENEFKVNIECNHATLAGKSFEFEVEYAASMGILGSIDANDGDLLIGWDLDLFNTNHRTLTQICQTLLKHPFTTGGLNFDAKVRRESVNIRSLFTGHIASMDAFAKSLKIAAQMEEEGMLRSMKEERYKGWNSELGKQILSGKFTLDQVAQLNINRQPVTNGQEEYESVYASYM